MTAPVSTIVGSGARKMVVFELNEDGLPAAPSTAAYEGIRVYGLRSFEMNTPDPQRIDYRGDDHVRLSDFLPPTEPITGTVTVEQISNTADAVFSQSKDVTLGEAKLFVVGTDKDGYEPDVAAILWQKGRDGDESGTSFGEPVYSGYIIPRGKFIAKRPGLNESAAQTVYNVNPVKTKKHLWGVAFSEAVEGVNFGQAVPFITENPPKVVAFKGDGTTTTFSLPTASPAVSTGKLHIVTKSGVSASTTNTTTSLTFGTAPADGDIVVVFYEEAV